MDPLAQQLEAYRAQYLAAHRQWQQAAITTLAMQAQWQHECLVAAHRKREQEEMEALALQAQRQYERQRVIDHCIAEWVLEELPYDVQSDLLDALAEAFEENEVQQELAAPCPSLSNEFRPSTPDELCPGTLIELCSEPSATPRSDSFERSPHNSVRDGTENAQPQLHWTPTPAATHAHPDPDCDYMTRHTSVVSSSDLSFVPEAGPLDE